MFALITRGEEYLFVKCDRIATPPEYGGLHDSVYYALSDKFTLSTAEGNQLYTVARIFKQLVSV
ncbi:hypothetical protein [Calothrix sp. NIES-3974]|uniref:hypothetical protein n=1 Tax=Calothrix sp. NIES-3974 TaxID=2005462 RepID=UPI0018D5216D|nr:hypothetical protein [Calothrix sp. NIES-3974]